MSRFWDKILALGNGYGARAQSWTRLAMDIVPCRCSWHHIQVLLQKCRWMAGGSELIFFRWTMDKWWWWVGTTTRVFLILSSWSTSQALRWVDARFSERNLSEITLSKIWCEKVKEMPTTGSHVPLWGGSCWLQDGSLLVRDSQGQTSSKCGYVCLLYLKFRFWMCHTNTCMMVIG